MRKAFTLIEMMISISILALMMLYLYQSYASLNISNDVFAKATKNITKAQKKKEVIFLDFSLALRDANSTLIILNQDAKEDVVFMQTSHSLHRRINPFVGYITKNKKLYRIESLQALREYPLSRDNEFEVDAMGEVNSFRVYINEKRSDQNTSEATLVHIDFKEEDDILMKIKMLNEH